MKPGSGRSSSDRQFFYLNKRPVDLPRVAKVINETFKQFSKKDYPVLFLDITMDTGNIPMKHLQLIFNSNIRCKCNS